MAIVISQSEIDDLQRAFQKNPADLGVGLYNPSTSEMHVASQDMVCKGGGHQGLADALGKTDTSDWRGFVVSSQGTADNLSHFNAPDQNQSGNSMRMRDDYFDQVKGALQSAGLIA